MTDRHPIALLTFARCSVLHCSPEDLSTGMVGQEIDGIAGYTPEAATALVRQILLRAAAN